MAEVLIKGFKMPENCWNCPFFHNSLHYIGDDELLERHTCLRTGERTDEHFIGYLKNCPLVELPPHGRLIDADAFAGKYIAALPDGIEDLLDKRRMPEFISQIQALLQDIAEEPTIIPASEEVDDGKV